MHIQFHPSRLHKGSANIISGLDITNEKYTKNLKRHQCKHKLKMWLLPNARLQTCNASAPEKIGQYQQCTK